METGEEHLTGESSAVFLLKAKIALAVAMIKKKPVGMSGREFAEAVACKLKSQNDSWREKAQGLQQEVLRLRQEMLIATVTSDTKNATEAAGRDSAVEDVSQDLFGPSEPPPDCDSETPDLLLEDSQLTVSTPQLPLSFSHRTNPQEKALQPHVQFLQSLCSLQRVRGGGLQALWFRPDGEAGSALVDSLCQLLDSVVAACRDPPPLSPSDLVLQACQAVSQVMDLLCSQWLLSAEFMRRVEEVLKELTTMLLHCNQQCGLGAAEKLMEYLITLGSNNMSKSFLIRHILCQITALADQLWQAFQAQEGSGLDMFPVDQYQNSCRLLWIAEELLQKSKVPCIVDLGSEPTGFLSYLEQRVFQLSDEFPLFSIYMWRIGGLLTSPPQTNKVAQQ